MTENSGVSAESLRLLQEGSTQDASDPPPPDETSVPGTMRAKMTEALTGAAMDTLAALPAASRLRFMAFLGLFERPEAVRVELISDTTGALRLTLTQPPEA
jgi:hypothetical protein